MSEAQLYNTLHRLLALQLIVRENLVELVRYGPPGWRLTTCFEDLYTEVEVLYQKVFSIYELHSTDTDNDADGDAVVAAYMENLETLEIQNQSLLKQVETMKRRYCDTEAQ